MNYENFILGGGFAEGSQFGNLVVGNMSERYDNRNRAIMGLMGQWYKFAKHDNHLETFECCGELRRNRNHKFCPVCSKPYAAHTELGVDEEIREAAASTFHEILSEGFSRDDLDPTYDFFKDKGWDLQSDLCAGGVIVIPQFDKFLELGFNGAVERFARNWEWDQAEVQVFEVRPTNQIEHPTLQDIAHQVIRNGL